MHAQNGLTTPERQPLLLNTVFSKIVTTLQIIDSLKFFKDHCTTNMFVKLFFVFNERDLSVVRLFCDLNQLHAPRRSSKPGICLVFLSI